MSDNGIPDIEQPKEGALRIWHVPQVPGPAFRYRVQSPEEGMNLLDTLALYDVFQLENNIKPDFANVGGLEVFYAEEGWTEWHDDEGRDVNEIKREEG